MPGSIFALVEVDRVTMRPAERRRVYIAGPISKCDLANNVNQATRAFIELAKAGLAPWCPQWSVYARDDALRVDRRNEQPQRIVCYGSAQPNDLTHADWLAVDIPWLLAADAVLRLPGESVGADREVREATARGIPVFQTVEAVIWWAFPDRITAA